MEALPTKFAPAELAPRLQLEADHALVAAHESLIQLLGAVSGLVLILNPQRQIVYASPDFLAFRRFDSLAPLLGKRLGQALQCIHSVDEPGGCGTSESCSVCRLTDSIVESGTLHSRSGGDCRLTVRSSQGLGSLDLEVTATPWALEGRDFTVFTLRDSSAETRRRVLERVFFHDLVNTAGGIAGLLDLLDEYPDLNTGKDLLGMSRRSSRDLLEEISAFQQLKAAESGDLSVRQTTLSAARVVQAVVDRMLYHSVGEGRRIEIEPQGPDITFLSDKSLVERVLVSMLKNALEATEGGSAVTVGWSSRPDSVTFRVHNEGQMAREVQLRVFQRSFSTKGADRGLGTYSMKLLGENVLEGRVAFTSSPAGTEFTLTLPNRC